MAESKEGNSKSLFLKHFSANLTTFLQTSKQMAAVLPLEFLVLLFMVTANVFGLCAAGLLKPETVRQH